MICYYRCEIVPKWDMSVSITYDRPFYDNTTSRDINPGGHSKDVSPLITSCIHYVCLPSYATLLTPSVRYLNNYYNITETIHFRHHTNIAYVTGDLIYIRVCLVEWKQMIRIPMRNISSSYILSYRALKRIDMCMDKNTSLYVMDKSSFLHESSIPPVLKYGIPIVLEYYTTCQMSQLAKPSLCGGSIEYLNAYYISPKCFANSYLLICYRTAHMPILASRDIGQRDIYAQNCDLAMRQCMFTPHRKCLSPLENRDANYVWKISDPRASMINSEKQTLFEMGDVGEHPSSKIGYDVQLVRYMNDVRPKGRIKYATPVSAYGEYEAIITLLESEMVDYVLYYLKNHNYSKSEGALRRSCMSYVIVVLIQLYIVYGICKQNISSSCNGGTFIDSLSRIVSFDWSIPSVIPSQFWVVGILPSYSVNIYYILFCHVLLLILPTWAILYLQGGLYLLSILFRSPCEGRSKSYSIKYRHKYSQMYKVIEIYYSYCKIHIHNEKVVESDILMSVYIVHSDMMLYATQLSRVIWSSTNKES